MKCKYKYCNQEAIAWFNKKKYCQIHFKILKEENRIGRYSKEKIHKYGYCSINGCNKKLGFTNKCGMCATHRDLEKIRLRREKQK